MQRDPFFLIIKRKGKLTGEKPFAIKVTESKYRKKRCKICENIKELWENIKLLAHESDTWFESYFSFWLLVAIGVGVIFPFVLVFSIISYTFDLHLLANCLSSISSSWEWLCDLIQP